MSRRKTSKRRPKSTSQSTQPIESATTEDQPQVQTGGWFDRLFYQPQPIDSVAFCRIAFGVAMLYTALQWFFSGHYFADYIAPPFHFTFFGFAWVKPLPEVGMWIVLGLLIAGAIGVTVGLLYRVSAAICLISFTYLFLLEASLYLNHHFLMCLLALAFLVIPAHRAWSIDALWRPGLRSDEVPGWALWYLRFQIGLPYVYGGLAKLNFDWLRGQPMNIWLSENGLRFLIGPIMESYWVALLFSYGGLIFDLSIVPLLLWKRTRLFAFCWAVMFHLLNAVGFDIGVFPWLMIAATTIFLPPDWPRKLVPDLTPKKALPPSSTGKQFGGNVVGNIGLAMLGVFIAWQLIFPFRHLLYPGPTNWTEEGQRFAWRMMLRTKTVGVQFIYFDPDTKQQRPVSFARWLTPSQLDKIGNNPEMLREFAHFLRERDGDYQPGDEVRVVAFCSLNGRKPQLLVDPDVDLSQQPRQSTPQPWIMPLGEPFRYEPFAAPPAEWLQHIEMPQLK